MFVMLPASLSLLVFLSPQHATQYVSRWKPHVVGGDVVSFHTTIEMYTKARICLEDPTCVGALAAKDLLFVLHRQQKDEALHLASLLCKPKCELKSCRIFRVWMHECYPTEHVYGTLLTEQERAWWDLSGFDA